MAIESIKEDSPVVAIEGLSCGYAGKAVVDRIQLLVRAEGFCALVGVNGSGKSTFLKTIVGLLPPVSGKIRFGSRDGRTASVGYVPQAEKLDSIFPVSVEDVVLMGAGIRGKGRGSRRSERQRIARDALGQVGLTDIRKRRMSELSGGQKQRVLLARALATQPDLLVLDEPTSGVDREAERDLMRLLAGIHERGVAILMASHNLELVERFARTVLWFRDGGMEAGPTAEILPKLAVGKGRARFPGGRSDE